MAPTTKSGKMVPDTSTAVQRVGMVQDDMRIAHTNSLQPLPCDSSVFAYILWYFASNHSVNSTQDYKQCMNILEETVI